MERQGCSLQARLQVLGRRVRLNSRLWCVWTKAATPTCSSLLALAAACWHEPVLAARGLLCQASVYIPPSGQHLPGPTLLAKLVYPPKPTVSTCWLLFYLISCMSAQYFLSFGASWFLRPRNTLWFLRRTALHPIVCWSQCPWTRASLSLISVGLLAGPVLQDL